MLLVGLTGGIGAGKSTVAAMLGRRGAVLVDADDLARRALQGGTEGSAAVLRRFGPTVAGPDGAIDRAALAEMVFADPEARRDLEAIVHPEVARLFALAVEPYRDTDRVVVYDVPLLAEGHLEPLFQSVVVVQADLSTRVARLVSRGVAERDARSRVAAQASDEERTRVATHIVVNDGSLQDLEREVDALWGRLAGRSISSAP